MRHFSTQSPSSSSWKNIYLLFTSRNQQKETCLSDICAVRRSVTDPALGAGTKHLRRHALMPLGALADGGRASTCDAAAAPFPGRYCCNRILSAAEVRPPKHLQSGAAAFPHKRLVSFFFSAGFDCVAVSAGDFDSIRELRRFHRSEF